MKLLAATAELFTFELNPEEHALFLYVLQQYPFVPPAHHRLNRASDIPRAEENQRLLEESLQAHRAAQQQQVQALLAAPERFCLTEKGATVTFARAEIEWLLQVVNDVRVGSWLALGSPTAEAEKRRPTKKTAPLLMNMEVAGFFQMHFLSALTGDEW